MFIHLLVGCLAFAGQPTTYDTINASKPVMMEEVVVTGAREKTDIRHLPMTISILNRDKIESQHTSSLLPR